MKRDSAAPIVIRVNKVTAAKKLDVRRLVLDHMAMLKRRVAKEIDAIE